MANLEFCNTHNMVAYLNKIEGSEGFHQIVDFLNSSHIRYALTENPTIYVSLIQQFWNTTTARTLDNGEMKITAIICLATNRTFNFSKMIFDGMVKNLESKHKFLMYLRFIQVFLNKHKRLLLPHNRTYIAPTLTQKLFSNMRTASKGYTRVDIPLFPTVLVQGPVVQGEGSTIPESMVPQPRSHTQTNVADEAASTGVDVKHGGDATTVTSLDAGQG
ncbi:hypothetical protein Tco_1375912 [Tanacetum coccineum]